MFERVRTHSSGARGPALPLLRSLLPGVIVSAFVALAAAPVACSSREPEKSTYYQRVIAPTLVTSCVRTNTGAACHVATEKGNAFGNLDTSTFERLAKRRDLLADYGPYGQPAFLLKSIPDYQVQVDSFDGTRTTITTDIKHTGGPILDPTASAYQTLRRWIQNGATENNTGAPPKNFLRARCSTAVPTAAGFDANVDPNRPDFATFRDRVNPALQTCAAGNCHGVASNELYLTCGDSPEQVRWNYFAAREYLAQTPEQSELARRPLSPSQGGSYHEGGVIYASQSDPTYRAIVEWAQEHGPLDVQNLPPAFSFFARRVQPMLVKKGCVMMHCHSASMFHDYRLRGGSGGSFSFAATRRNYELSLHQVSIESPDPNASRLIRKNLYRSDVFDNGEGIAHRGGPLFEDFAGDPARGELCDQRNIDYDGGDLDAMPAYCVVREWIRRERAARVIAPLSAIVYVKRRTGYGGDRPQDFDVYRAGADLRRADATLGASGGVEVGADRSLTAGCGLDPATADIRRPAVSWDGKKVAFAARANANEPLAVYEMNADGSACQKHPAINAGPASENGLLIHNFDPAYSPEGRGGEVHLVFASTRGNAPSPSFDYSGPQRTPADPSKPNANLYAFEPDPERPGQTRIRQLTYQLNLERYPAFMADGRLIMTSEKRAPNFYQLAGRRLNVDGGDYHPLYAQRRSIGFSQFLYGVELADKNFAAIFSEPGAPYSAGALGIINRSIGIDFTSNDPADYPIDGSVIDPAAPMSPEPEFFLRSLRFPDGDGAGRPDAPTAGVYTSPSPLPSGNLLVSYGAATTARAFGGDFDLYELDPNTGQKRKLLGDPGSAEIEAVAIYGRVSQGIFESTLDEPNGHTRILPGRSEANIHLLDTRILASLLFQNTPTGRLLDDEVREFELYEDLPPPLDVTSFERGGNAVVSDAFGKVFVRRRKLGRVPVAPDGSAHFQVPGGVPFLFALPETRMIRERGLPRFQREAMTFFPGEYAHQSFKREFFDGLCGHCHGAVSGKPFDISVQPDMLTQASTTASRDATPTNLAGRPSDRGPVEGPPPAP
jgi:hypothetical protein